MRRSYSGLFAAAHSHVPRMYLRSVLNPIVLLIAIATALLLDTCHKAHFLLKALFNAVEVRFLRSINLSISPAGF